MTVTVPYSITSRALAIHLITIGPALPLKNNDIPITPTNGFKFAGCPQRIVLFFIVVLGMTILTASLMFFKPRRARRRAAYNNLHNQDLNEAFPQHRSSDIELTNAAVPLAYSLPPSGRF